MSTIIKTYRHSPNYATDPTGTLVDTETDPDDGDFAVTVDSTGWNAGSYEITVKATMSGYSESLNSNAVPLTVNAAGFSDITYGDGTNRFVKFATATGANTLTIPGLSIPTNTDVAILVACAGAQPTAAGSTFTYNGEGAVAFEGGATGDDGTVRSTLKKERGYASGGSGNFVVTLDATPDAFAVAIIYRSTAWYPAAWFRHTDHTASGGSTTTTLASSAADATPRANAWQVCLGVIRPNAGGTYSPTLTAGANATNLQSWRFDGTNDAVFVFYDRWVEPQAASTTYDTTATLDAASEWAIQSCMLHPE